MSTENQKPSTATPENTAKSAPSDTDHVMQYFEFAHLPDHLKAISEPFSAMAHWIVSHVPRNPERAKALNKLLEAKDCAVRAKNAK